MVDLGPPFSSEVGHDVCEALENLFSLACNVSGPSRIPLFSVLALYRYPEVRKQGQAKSFQLVCHE